jgi:hypothetical protein
MVAKQGVFFYRKGAKNAEKTILWLKTKHKTQIPAVVARMQCSVIRFIFSLRRRRGRRENHFVVKNRIPNINSGKCVDSHQTCNNKSLLCVLCVFAVNISSYCGVRLTVSPFSQWIRVSRRQSSVATLMCQTPSRMVCLR